MPITSISRTYIIQRLHFLSRTVWFYKFAVSCTVLVLASSLEYGANAVDESGVKAAFFALCAACILLVDLLPSAHGRYGIFATILTRASGALLAFGAGLVLDFKRNERSPAVLYTSVCTFVSHLWSCQ